MNIVNNDFNITITHNKYNNKLNKSNKSNKTNYLNRYLFKQKILSFKNKMIHAASLQHFSRAAYYRDVYIKLKNNYQNLFTK